MNQLTELELQKVKGYFAAIYLAAKRIKNIDERIAQCRQELDAKGIQYDKENFGGQGLTHDHKLMIMIDKINELEIKKKIEKQKARKLLSAYKKLKLTEDENRILNYIYLDNKSYVEIGKELNCGKSQVHRKVMDIYEKAYPVFDRI